MLTELTPACPEPAILVNYVSVKRGLGTSLHNHREPCETLSYNNLLAVRDGTQGPGLFQTKAKLPDLVTMAHQPAE